ncbi:MAG TPA: response regulator transcription factor [Candidatus Limnocylindrales bacterium]|nr:response regulator transcription factor [Candidatus Limnocylindrales bacterium]
MLADDSALIREGVARLLGAAGMEVVAETHDTVGLLAAVQREHPDVAIVDIRMPPTFALEGLEAAHRIRANQPSTAVLLLSTYVVVEDAMDLLSSSSGGVGYLLKDNVSNADEFVAAVRRVAAGGTAIDSSLVTELFSRQRRLDPLAQLTPRERDVLALMAQGRSNAGIAGELWVTEGSVEKYVKSVLGKLGIEPDHHDHRRVLAVLTYLENR